MNKVILMGRLTRDPEVRYSQGTNSTVIARYTLAVDRRFKRDGEPTADFINCVALGKAGEFAEKYFRQGLKVTVAGRIQTGSYTNKDGVKVYTTDVFVEEQEFAESKNSENANTNTNSNHNPNSVPANRAYDRLATMDKESFRMLSNTKIYDNQGEKIGEINTGNYKYLKISDIPIELQNAYIAAEDQNFKHHHGVDYKATIRAGLALIVNRGEITQGGSTITQQVIKNNMLSQEQSFMRKFMEILIAPELEKKYSKQEIMEFYCNSNYYGNGCYGIESASQYYFGKSAKDMTLAECAMMAGVSNSPNNYNPVTSMQLAKKKMYSVLNKMKVLGLITEKEELAKKQKIIVTQTETKVAGANNYMTTYAVHCAALELMKNDGFNFEYIFDSENQYKKYQQKYKAIYNEKSSLIRGGGYRIYTSFDMNVQNELQKAIDEQLSENQQKQENGKYQLQGAGVCIDNKTNYIVGIVGGRGNEDQFNRGFLATRQPGSAIKPLLVYAPAYDNGIISPASVYTDKKIESKGYSPKNAYNKFYGDMNIRRAVSISTNTIAYQVFNDVGQKKALEYLEKMQFSGLRYADNTAVSISLGGFTNGVKVDEMAKAYAALQHDGQWTEKNCIVKLEHEKEGILFEGEKTKSIISCFTVVTARFYIHGYYGVFSVFVINKATVPLFYFGNCFSVCNCKDNVFFICSCFCFLYICD